MNWIIPSIIYVIGCVVMSLLFRRKNTELQRKIFDLNWQIREEAGKMDAMEVALVTIGAGEILKREMEVIAKEVLIECDMIVK